MEGDRDALFSNMLPWTILAVLISFSPFPFLDQRQGVHLWNQTP